MPCKTRVYPKRENGLCLVGNPRTEVDLCSADVSGGGTQDEALRTTAWEAIQPVALAGRHINVILAVEPGFSNMN